MTDRAEPGRAQTGTDNIAAASFDQRAEPLTAERLHQLATTHSVTLRDGREVIPVEALEAYVREGPTEEALEGVIRLIEPIPRDGLKQAITELQGAFPDVRYAIDDAFTRSDQVVHRLLATGTMTGSFMGIPATGKRATWTEIHIGRVVNGRLTEHWGLVDQLGMLVQLDVVPEPGPVPATV